jgi:hypothetical protein
MSLPVWEQCCYYDVLPICVNDMHVLYWECLVMFCNSWIALLVWGNSLFCAFPISSCRNTAYQVLHTGRQANTCELLSASPTQHPYHILSPASKLYCWACLLQCLTTKAQPQTWQSHSYLFRLWILTFVSSYSENKSHSSLICSRCLSCFWPRTGKWWARNMKQVMADSRKCYCQTSANSHTRTNIKSDAE